MSLEVDHAKAAELEREFDAEMRFRPLGASGTRIVMALLLALSTFHFYTAGFGLLREQTHRGVHMALVLGLIFLVFAANRRGGASSPAPGWWRPGGVPLYDWALFAAAVVSSLYLPAIFHDIAFKTGNPDPIDVVMGTTLTLVVLEATRRTMGWALVIITLGIMASAFAGPQPATIAAVTGTNGKSSTVHFVRQIWERMGLTAASIGTLGIVRQRVAALQAMAAEVAAGRIELHRSAPLQATLDALRALPGIGDWSAQLIAMRALAWPDAWPATDIGVLNALREHTGGERNAKLAEAHAERWRPWRAYAVMKLWLSLEE